MDQLKRMAVFAEVVAAGSLTGAARRLGMTPSAVSQHLRQLESALGLALLHRSTRKLTLTEAGARYIEGCTAMVAAARAAELKVRSAISCALGCPYQGEVTPDAVEHLVKLFKQIGVQHCGVADTIGVGTPRKVQAVMERALKHYPLAEVSGHFHDTYGQALSNIYACLELGIHTFDTSVAGLGGCPYAKGATGNVATEDVVFMLHGMGIHTGIDLDALVDTGGFISGVLGRPPVSRVGRALLTKRGQVFA